MLSYNSALVDVLQRDFMNGIY